MYGLLIMLGAITGYFYLSRTSKKELGIAPEKIQNLAIIIIVAAFVGGKLLFYLEKPSYYLTSWDNMARNFRTGFVFYGSLLFALASHCLVFPQAKISRLANARPNSHYWSYYSRLWSHGMLFCWLLLWSAYR